MPLQPRWLDYLHDVPVMEQIMKRLGEMSQLLLALNDNAAGVNRRLDRMEESLGDLTAEVRRNSQRLSSVELRLGELGVRISALETA